jgi:hypothetical protein
VGPLVPVAKGFNSRTGKLEVMEPVDGMLDVRRERREVGWTWDFLGWKLGEGEAIWHIAVSMTQLIQVY